VKSLAGLCALLFVSSAFAQTIELPPGGSTTVGGVTVICVKSRLPECKLHRNGNELEVWAGDELTASFADAHEGRTAALAWIKELRLTSVCK